MLGLKMNSSWAKWTKYTAVRLLKHEKNARGRAARRQHLLLKSLQTLKVKSFVFMVPTTFLQSRLSRWRAIPYHFYAQEGKCELSVTLPLAAWCDDKGAGDEDI